MQKNEFVDVIIVGAGLSGIGAAHHLQEKCPTKSYLILEGRDALGGTWELFRYPGIRSDSDMHTLGYEFKPWREAKAIADGPAILRYINETAVESGIDQHIRYGQRVTEATWSSADIRWTLTIQQTASGESTQISCNFLLMCAGYYSYEAGYTPQFAGRERFSGEIIHPQHWPEELDYSDKRIVVIGSGATAMTLVPELAQQAQHVTLLQRSPTYVAPMPDVDRVANVLRRLLPEKIAYAITRWKNVTIQQYIYRQSRKNPDKVREQMIKLVRKELDADYDIETHFMPSYDPWDQRVCLVPNGDLFAAMRAGKVTVVTDHIDTFTEMGIRLQSGEELSADIIITATGLELLPLGGVTFTIDGQPLDFAERFIYKGCMYSDVPNLASIFGYVNASWTLRADLIATYICRVLNEMDAKGERQVTPCLRPQDRGMTGRPVIDDFSSNYIKRKVHLLPMQGKPPWTNPQDYSYEKKVFRDGEIEDGVLMFG